MNKKHPPFKDGQAFLPATSDLWLRQPERGDFRRRLPVELALER